MRERNATVNGALMLLIYGVFALFSLLLVVTGARVYRNIVTTGQENTEVRAAFSYVSGKLHMSDSSFGAPRLWEEDGMEILALETGMEGYETRIFYYDGAIRELYQASDQEFMPEMGEKIAQVRDFHMETTEEGSLLLKVTDAQGTERSLHLYIEGKNYE